MLELNFNDFEQVESSKKELEIVSKSDNEADYYDRKELSRSTLCDLNKSPFYYWSKNIAKNLAVDTKAMHLGRAFHSFILEPEAFKNDYVIEPTDINKRTKAGKEEYQLFIDQNPGKEIISISDFEHISKLSQELNKYDDVIQLLNICDKKEEEFYFKYANHDFRSKLDAVCTSKNIIIDLKTVCGYDKHFTSKLIDFNYPEQVFLYSEAYEQKYGTRPDFYIVAIEKKAPFEVKIFNMNIFYNLGKFKVDSLITKYEKCIKKWGASKDVPWYESKIINLQLPYYEAQKLADLENKKVINF